MDRVILILLSLISIGVATSFLLSRFFTRKWVWYVPSMIGVLVIAYYTLKIQSENMEGFEELGYIILSMMAAAFTTGNLLANVVIHLRRTAKKKKSAHEINNE